jgi:hypothetical protein
MEENVMKIRPMLRNMKVGESLVFPISKTKSIRTQATELGAFEHMKFKTRINRLEQQITVWKEK